MYPQDKIKNYVYINKIKFAVIKINDDKVVEITEEINKFVR